MARFREADLPAVAEYRPGAQIDFTDGVNIACRSGEPACAASEMQSSRL
jgi:hypothetical protein